MLLGVAFVIFLLEKLFYFSQEVFPKEGYFTPQYLGIDQHQREMQQA